ncbi:MAG: uL23 family ribosomal protein [Planctomycetota bacterium]
MSLEAYQVVKRPIISEKSQTIFHVTGQYVFEVALDATKPQVKRAIPELFGADIKVAKVNFLYKRPRDRRVFGKDANPFQRGRTAKTKRAIITLAKGSRKIELM